MLQFAVIFMQHIALLLLAYGQYHVPAYIYTFSGMRTPLNSKWPPINSENMTFYCEYQCAVIFMHHVSALLLQSYGQ